MAYENPDLLEVMSIGRQFGPEELQILMVLHQRVIAAALLRRRAPRHHNPTD